MPQDGIQKSNKTVIFMAILAVFAILAVVFVGVPSYQNLKTQTYEYTVAQQNLSAGDKYITEINTAYKSYLSNKNLADILIKALPANTDAAAALAQINAVASDTGLTLVSLTPVNTDQNVQVITANVAGNYNQLKSFLQKIENNIMPFKVTSIAVVAYEGQDNQLLTSGSYEIELSVASKNSTSGSNE